MRSQKNALSELGQKDQCLSLGGLQAPIFYGIHWALILMERQQIRSWHWKPISEDEALTQTRPGLDSDAFLPLLRRPGG